MGRNTSLLSVAVVTLAVGVAWASSAVGTGPAASTVAGDSFPKGYRDWKLISVAHEEGDLNDIRAILGNDIAVAAYRAGKIPFPDGAVIARIAWRYVPSPENNAAFGREQSFIAGLPTNVQFMSKDSRKFASTGGWGFAQFNDGKPVHLPMQACFACHVPVRSRDYVFSRYAP